jgi:hypothetical protein
MLAVLVPILASIKPAAFRRVLASSGLTNPILVKEGFDVFH